MSEHITADTWGRITRGERFEGEKDLAAHLRAGCDVCEEILAGLHHVDGLDGETDRWLLAVAPPTASRDDLAFERVMRRVRLEAQAQGESGSAYAPRRHGRAIPLSIAAALVLGGMTILTLKTAPQPSHYEGIKGGSTVPEIALSFAVTGPEGDLERGAPGATYAEDQAVMIRYQLSSPAFVMLLRITPNDGLEVLAQPGRLGAGRHDLTVNDMPAGVSLEKAIGRNRFLAVASNAPLTAERVTALARSLEGNGALAEVRAEEDLQVAWFDIDVTPTRR